MSFKFKKKILHSNTCGNQSSDQMTNSNKFSAVLLGDLNDFIAPSQACVNPIFVGNSSNSQGNEETKKSKKIELVFEDDMTAKKPSGKGLIKLDVRTKAAKVSLTDCLACSGCVTSAETVLLKQQSVQEFFSILSALTSKKHPTFQVSAATISPQVRASFAVRFNVTPQIAYLKLANFLKLSCGVDIVLDAGALPSDISQLEIAKEFVYRYRSEVNRLPVLTSSCPGWVCYAEKTHGFILPYLSNVKSSQQISGSLLKNILASASLLPNQIYHVSVMQCPDKKLEGSRKEFWMGSDASFAEVNCVLTATELCDCMLEVFPNFSLDEIFQNLPCDDTIFSHPIEKKFQHCITSEESSYGGSGGLSAFVFRYAAKELFGVEIPYNSSLPFRPGKNSDTWNLDLEIDSKIVLRFSTSYGFRNIQDVVRKIKNGHMQSHFVEVMACPGGCTNGGGLLLPQQVQTTKKELSDQLKRQMGLITFHDASSNNASHDEILHTYPSMLRTTFNVIDDGLKQNGLLQQW